MLQCTILLQQQLSGSLRLSLSEANCKQGCVSITREQNRFLYSLIIISIYLACCDVAKNDIFVLLWGPLFAGAPVLPNMLNMPTSASARQSTDLSLATFRNRLKTFLFDADT